MKVSNTDKYVAKRIRTIRVLKGLSQQQIAQALNVYIQQVQKYEQATNRISSGRLYDLAQFLGLPITCFFDQHHYPKLDLDTSSNLSNKEILVLINSFGLIEDVGLRKHLLSVISLIAKH